MKTTVKTLVFARNGEAYPASVEVEVSKGIGIHVVGMPDDEVKQSLLRVVTAMQSMGLRIPGKKIVININGRPLKWFELLDYAILVSVSTATSKEAPGIIADAYYLGETSLDGRIYPLTEEQFYKVLQWKYQHGGTVNGDAKLLCSNAICGKLEPYEHRG